MPSALNLVHCKSPFVAPFSAQCYQGIADKDDFTDFIAEHVKAGDLCELKSVREHDRYSRLLRVYYHDNALIHTVIDIRAGIVRTIVYSVADKIDVLVAEYFVYQIRQYFDQF
ncbi:hypothetical protein LTF62_004602 [Salmonella enterica]|nr:hypothetical protein [Salmonella enterica]